jgi:hypothetical protein
MPSRRSIRAADKVDLPQIDVERLAAKLEEELNEESDKEIEHQYQVIVDCKDEAQQLELLEKLERQKYICRALTL